MNEQEKQLAKIRAAWADIHYAGHVMTVSMLLLLRDERLDQATRDKFRRQINQWDEAFAQMDAAWKNQE